MKTMTRLKYADAAVVLRGFYKGCAVRIVRSRLFGLWYYVTITSPYFVHNTRIFGWNLKLISKASKKE